MNDIETLFDDTTMEELEYVNWVAHEVMRINGPSVRSMGYIATDDIQTKGGLRIEKGTAIHFNLSAPSNDPKQWKEPHKFIPERFNPESPYFKTPGGKARSHYAWIPYGVGARACTGRGLAMLELKVMIICVTLFLDWDCTDKSIDRKSVV